MAMPKAATMRVDVKPAMLRWARDRADIDPDALAHRFPKLADWEREEARPTLKQRTRLSATSVRNLDLLRRSRCNFVCYDRVLVSKRVCHKVIVSHLKEGVHGGRLVVLAGRRIRIGVGESKAAECATPVLPGAIRPEAIYR